MVQLFPCISVKGRPMALAMKKDCPRVVSRLARMGWGARMVVDLPPSNGRRARVTVLAMCIDQFAAAASAPEKANWLEAIKSLLEAGASPEDPCWTERPAMWPDGALSSWRPSWERLFNVFSDSSIPDRDNASSRLASMLLGRGWTSNSTDAAGRNGLHHAAITNLESVARELARMGADPTKKDVTGMAPGDYAITESMASLLAAEHIRWELDQVASRCSNIGSRPKRTRL